MTHLPNHDLPPREPSMQAHPGPAPLIAAPASSMRPAAIVPTPRSSGRIYAVAWIAAGLLSAGYVATIIRQPDAVTNMVMRPDTPSSNVNRLAQSVARTEADVQVLKQAVTSLQGGLIDVKTRADAADQRERQIVERIGAVETRVEQFAVASVSPPVAEPQKAQRQAAAAVPPPAPAPVAVAPPKQVVQQAPKTAVAPTVINQKQVKTIETASLPPSGQRELADQRQAPAPANAAAALADSSHGVIVASGPSVDALRLSWSLLSDRHKATLGKMEPRVVTTDGQTYQLVAGPLPSDAEAAKVCTGLKARGIACRPSEFKGDALQ